MAEFSNEEYLRALADNGDREAAKEYEQALDNRIFQLQISLAQTSDHRVVGKCKSSWNKRKRKKGTTFKKKRKKL